jgi:protein gp37
MAMWDPWRGCHRYSEGCDFCYIHKGDARRGVDTNIVAKTDRFDAPIRRTKSGDYRMKPGQTVYVCFSSDFLIEDADAWRGECWRMMKERSDLTFIFLTKRIERFMDCVPEDWGDGYENVIVGCTVENQSRADYRLAIFDRLPVKRKNIICQPLIGPIDISAHLENVELVVVGGESDSRARPLDYSWVLAIREQCVARCAARNVHFQFRQCGTNFVKDGKTYRLNVRLLCSQARKAGIDF